MEEEDRQTVEDQRKAAWEAYQAPIRQERNQVVRLIDEAALKSSHPPELAQVARNAGRQLSPLAARYHGCSA